MNFNLIEWNPKLNLDDFYKEAGKKGFVNNSSQKSMIDCFKNEKEWNAWILYKNDKAVGSVAAHSFDDVMGPETYRVLTRVCAFPEVQSRKGLLTINRMMRQHQHISDQFFLPKCIAWSQGKNIYATSNNNPDASQRLVHKFYFPTLEEMKIVKKVKNVFYRGTEQTVWQIYPDEFLCSINRYHRWL